MHRYFRKTIALFLLAALLCPVLLPVSAAVYDPVTDGITSRYYHIDDQRGVLSGIAPGTSARHLLSVCLPNDCTLSTEIPATGATIHSGSHSLTLVVTGDLSGDGKVNTSDLMMLKGALAGGTLKDLATIAADINYDGELSNSDLLLLQAHLSGQRSIQAGRPDSAESAPLIILAPRSSEIWKGPEGTAKYSCGTGTITVNYMGKITGIAHGSDFVYALDANGSVLDQIMVSVVEQPLTVSFSTAWQALPLGETITLTPTINHPVSSAIAWKSSNSAVASVSESGEVIPKGLGSSVITATLPNGSSARVTVKVTQPQGFLYFDRELYKVKPGNYRHPRLVLSGADSMQDILWTSSDPTIATVSQDGTVFGVTYGDVTITATNIYSGETATCRVSVCDVKQVALTFDDGPGGNTKWLLNYLEEKNIPATFFLIGKLISLYPDTVIRQAADGHEIGYHSYTHENQLYLSSERITEEFTTTNAMLFNLTGRSFTLWRTPGGNYDQRVLDAVPLPHIHWSADTLDWQNKNAETIRNRIVGLSIDGSIILMHDIYGSTVQGAILGIEALEDAGFEFVTVSELLARDGDPAQNSESYQDGY